MQVNFAFFLLKIPHGFSFHLDWSPWSSPWPKALWDWSLATSLPSSWVLATAPSTLVLLSFTERSTLSPCDLCTCFFHWDVLAPLSAWLHCSVVLYSFVIILQKRGNTFSAPSSSQMLSSPDISYICILVCLFPGFPAPQHVYESRDFVFLFTFHSRLNFSRCPLESDIDTSMLEMGAGESVLPPFESWQAWDYWQSDAMWFPRITHKGYIASSGSSWGPPVLEPSCLYYQEPQATRKAAFNCYSNGPAEL